MGLRLIGEIAGRMLGSIRHDECCSCGGPINDPYLERLCLGCDLPESDCDC